MGWNVFKKAHLFKAPVKFDSTVEFGANSGIDLTGVVPVVGGAAVTAAGSGQSTYTALTKQVSAVTGADGTKGVALPAAATGKAMLIINTDASNVLKVSPVNGGNDAINALTAGTGVFDLGPGQSAWFFPTSATQWYVAAEDAVTATPAELNKLDDSVTVLTKGAGVSAAESYASGYLRNGTLITTRIVLDLTGLVGSATDLDIIGNTGGAASCHWGQITAALNGSIIGGRVTCLEVPAGGTNDIDFYSAAESTGAQDALVTGLTETVLITAGGAWTSGASKGMTALPAANEYLYLTNGAGAAGGTFTAGKFLIELFGYAA